MAGSHLQEWMNPMDGKRKKIPIGVAVIAGVGWERMYFDLCGYVLDKSLVVKA